MAKTPKGATMTVVIICAPHNTTCSIPMGKPIFKAQRRMLRCGRNLPFSPAMRSNDERLHKYQVCTKAMTVMAATVPRAAPATPRLAPGMVMCMPATANGASGI